MIPDRLKKLRKQAGLTQKQIAEKIHVGQNSYSNWEKGNRTPIQPTIDKLAEILNTSSEYLTGITDDPTCIKISETDLDSAIDNSVAYDGTPITDNDKEIIKDCSTIIFSYHFFNLLYHKKQNKPFLTCPLICTILVFIP